MTRERGGILDLLRTVPRRPLLLQVLSLYLLLLAFFVLLNSMSRVDETRLRAVKGSLNETFASTGRPAARTIRLTSALGNIVDNAGFLDRIGRLVRTELAFARITEVTPGRVMEVSLPAAALFRAGRSAIDPLYRPTLELIARSMKNPPVGVRYDVDIVVGTTGNDALPGERSAWLATVFDRAGVPARNVAAGVEYGTSDAVVLRFRVRREREGRLILGEPSR